MFYDWHPDGRGDHFGVYKNIANPKIHDNVRKLSMTVVLNDDFSIACNEVLKLVTNFLK